MKSISRRKFLHLAGLAAGSGLLAACSSAPAAAPTSAPAAGAAPKAAPTVQPTGGSPAAVAPQGGSLTISMYDSPHYQTMKTVMDRFTQKTGIKVTFDISPQGDPFYKKQASFLMTGQSSPDVVFFNDGMLAQYVGGDFLAPVDEIVNDASYNWEDFLPSVRDAASFSKTPGGQKHIYGVPTEVSTFYLFYRTDLIKEPPKTWDEYIQVAKEHTQSINPSSTTKYGTTIEGKSNSNYKEWFMWLWSYGGDVFDKNMHPIFNSPEAVKSLEDDFDLLLKWKAVPPDSTKFIHPDVTAALKQGLVAMAPKWDAGYRDMLNPKAPVIGGKLAVAMIPGVKQPDGSIKSVPFMQQWMFGINAASKQKDAAMQFLKYWTSQDGLTVLGPESGAVVPGRKSLLFNKDYFKDNPIYPIHAESLAHAKPSPEFFVEWSQIGDTMLGPQMEQAIAGTKSCKQALDDAAAQASDLLKKAGYLK